MNVVHRGYAIDFKKGKIRRNRDHMSFDFHYTTKGVKMEPVAESMLPAFIKKWVESNAADFLFAD